MIAVQDFAKFRKIEKEGSQEEIKPAQRKHPMPEHPVTEPTIQRKRLFM